MGRIRRRKHHLEGQRFGRLVVIRRGSNKRRAAGKGTTTRWWCICDCGKQKLTPTSSLVSGNTKSCGCLAVEAVARLVKWDCKNNRVWRIWRGMCGRSPVTDPRVLAIYRGVGTHDPAWDDFAVFERWALAHGYAEDLTIDRIDYTVGYWPENCRWITLAQQQRNKSNNVSLVVNGERMILVEASERFGITSGTIRKRLAAGWTAEQAVTKRSNQRSLP